MAKIRGGFLYGFPQRHQNGDRKRVRCRVTLVQNATDPARETLPTAISTSTFSRRSREQIVGARVRRQQVAFAQAQGRSSRGVRLLSVERSTFGYQSRLQARDAPAVVAMRALSAVSAVWLPAHSDVLTRVGHPMSTDRADRLLRETGLQVPWRRPRRRVATGRRPRRWRQITCGLRLRVRCAARSWRKSRQEV